MERLEPKQPSHNEPRRCRLRPAETDEIIVYIIDDIEFRLRFRLSRRCQLAQRLIRW